MRFKTTPRAVILAFGILAVSASMLVAQPTPVGNEFQVNTYTTRDQSSPRVAMVANGDFVVVWNSYNQDGSNWGVFGQRFDSAGTALASEFQVNASTLGSQAVGDVKMNADGGFIVVWNDPDASLDDIFGQRFDRSGNPLGGNFQINSTFGNNSFPRLGIFPSGGFIVVWHRENVSNFDILAKRYNSMGGSLGSQFRVNSNTVGNQVEPHVTVGSDGSFVSVWHSGIPDQIFARRHDSAGSPIGTDFQVSFFSGLKAAVTSRPGRKEFLVVWYGSEAHARLYDSTGNPATDPFRVSTFNTAIQHPDVTMAANGDFVVIWIGSDGDSWGVSGQHFDSAANPLGGEFQVNTYTTARQYRKDVAGDAAGSFIAVWDSGPFSGPGPDGDEAGIFAQRFRSPCSASSSLTALQWKMISLPCDPGTAISIADVFGDDLSGTYDWDWVVYERDEAGGSYNKLLFTDPLEMGVGYWIVTADSGETVQVDGLSPYVTDVALTASASGVQNLVGHPFDFDVCWADVRVIDGGSVLTLDEADPAGECEQPSPGPTCVMSRIMNKWTGAAYAPYDGTTPGAEGTLASFDGLWVKAFKSGISLRIPARAAASCSGAKSLDDQALKSRAGDWYVRLIAEAGELRDPDNVFGHLAASADGYDAHDLPELPASVAPYLTVVFPHPDWPARAGDYATDYHARKRGTDGWRVAVRASSGVGPVMLRWEGPPDRLRRLQLRDEANGKTMAMRPGRSYTFQIRGGERLFAVIAR